MYVVFGMLVKLGSIEHYSVYLLLGIVLWTFFSEATNQGLESIVSRGDIIRKIDFPKYIIVLSTTISALVNLTLNLSIVVVFMLLNGVGLHMSALLFPLYIVEIYVLALGLALLLSALNVKFRDMSHIWEIIMQAAFYATPIIYPLSIVIDKSQTAAKFMMMNPLAQAIQDARYSLITHDTATVVSLFKNSWYALIPIGIVIIVFTTGVVYFKRNSKKFAENV